MRRHSWRSERRPRAATTSPAAALSRTAILPRRFARLLSEERPKDALRRLGTAPISAPEQRRARFRCALAARRAWQSRALRSVARPWFGRLQTSVWVTEYGHETLPGNPIGIEPELQATLRGRSSRGCRPESRGCGCSSGSSSATRRKIRGGAESLKRTERQSPRSRASAPLARKLDGRNPVLPANAALARIPVLELARYTEPGDPVEVRLEDRKPFSVPMRMDGWLAVPLKGTRKAVLRVRAIDAYGHFVDRALRFDHSLS